MWIDFLYAALMSPALERRFKKCAKTGFCFIFADETSGQTKYISIVVGAGQFCQFPLPGQGGSQMRMSVGADAHPVAAAANQQAQ